MSTPRDTPAGVTGGRSLSSRGGPNLEPSRQSPAVSVQTDNVTQGGSSAAEPTQKVVAEDLRIVYEGKTRGSNVVAVHGLSLTIPIGRFVSIVGRSGCGKSTFLNAIQGLKSIDDGTLTIDGEPVTGPNKDQGMVFQDPSLLPWRNVYRNITYGLEVQGRIGQADRADIQASIELVGLSGFESSYPHQLSGGMRQRVNLARALLVDPALLLLDEPFGALDALTRYEMQVELTRIWQSSLLRDDNPLSTMGDSRTAILITHDVEEAVYLSDEVIVFSPRPAQVREVVQVPFERPRPPDQRRDPEFQTIVKHITQLLIE